MHTNKVARLYQKIMDEGLISVLLWLLQFLYRQVREWKNRWLRFKQDKVFSLRNRLLFNRPVRIPLEDISILMAPKGAVVANIWSGLRILKLNEATFIFQILEPGMTFFDIGANTGLFTLVAAKKDPSIQVWAFEPCKWTFQVLEENVHLNNLSNAHLYPIALGNYTGEATLQINAIGKDGLNIIGRPSHPDCQIIDQETVPITTLDAFLDANQILWVDVMKVDVEGAELLVFQGARRLLRKSEAPLILYESYSWCTKGFDYHPVEIMWLLQDCGYSFFVLNSENGKLSHRKPEHGYDNMIVAVKREHPCFSKLQERLQ